MNNETIKHIRHYLKMSQYEFCDYTGITYSVLAGIEAGSKNVSDRVASKISHVFDVTNPEFLEFVRRNKELKKMIEPNKALTEVDEGAGKS